MKYPFFLVGVVLCGVIGLLQGAEAGASKPNWLIIGYSQVGERGTGWFQAGGFVQTAPDPERWSILWAGGAGVDRWSRADYHGWNQRVNPLVPGTSVAAPDHIVLSISGPYGPDVARWKSAIEETLGQIRTRYPSAKVIYLQPVVGGPDGQTCSAPAREVDGRQRGGGRVRASWQHAHIANAIRQVVESPPFEHPVVRQGALPTVRSCADYRDGLGHLTQDGAVAVGETIGRFYSELSQPR